MITGGSKNYFPLKEKNTSIGVRLLPHREKKKTQTWSLKLPPHGNIKGPSLVTLHLKLIPNTTHSQYHHLLPITKRTVNKGFYK